MAEVEEKDGPDGCRQTREVEHRVEGDRWRRGKKAERALEVGKSSRSAHYSETESGCQLHVPRHEYLDIDRGELAN